MTETTGHRTKAWWIVDLSNRPLTALRKILLYGAGVVATLSLLFVVGSWIWPSGGDTVSTASTTTSTTTYVSAAALYDQGCIRPWYNQGVSGDPSTPTQINPSGDCDWTIKAPGKCVMAKRADRVADDKWYGPLCDDAIVGKQRVEAPLDIEWIYAATAEGKPAEGFIARARLIPN